MFRKGLSPKSGRPRDARTAGFSRSFVLPARLALGAGVQPPDRVPPKFQSSQLQHLEGQGDLVHRVIASISYIVGLAIPIINVP